MKKEDILLIVAFVCVAVSFIGIAAYMTPLKPALLGFVAKSGNSQSNYNYTAFSAIFFFFLLLISIIFLLKTQKNAKKKKRNRKK